MTTTADIIYLPTPRKDVPATDPRVAAAILAAGPLHYVAPAAAARIVAAAVDADMENGVYRTQLAPLYDERRALTEAMRNPGAVVKRHRFGKGVKETRDHWRLRAVLAVLEEQAARL